MKTFLLSEYIGIIFDIYMYHLKTYCRLCRWFDRYQRGDGDFSFVLFETLLSFFITIRRVAGKVILGNLTFHGQCNTNYSIIDCCCSILSVVSLERCITFKLNYRGFSKESQHCTKSNESTLGIYTYLIQQNIAGCIFLDRLFTLHGF